ncbi:MAG: DUF1016 N-terminal domain-containing protein [Tannerella sp.]|jgi:hypothetical protein|nr:DUF1016 N-terminal domain-containing protein [Tannerella sp.]
MAEIAEHQFVEQLKQIIQVARSKVYSAINFAQVEANWLIGQRIVEQEQNGEVRAEYGKYVIQIASQELTAEFGKGYSRSNLFNFKRFYLLFSDFQIVQTVSGQFKNYKQQLPLLSWSHYERLIRVESAEARQWYMYEAAEQMWSFRTLDRNINTQYYERLLLSQITEPVIKEMQEKTKTFQQDKPAFIKNPTVLEFLGLPGNSGYVEQDVEKEIIETAISSISRNFRISVPSQWICKFSFSHSKTKI